MINPSNNSLLIGIYSNSHQKKKITWLIIPFFKQFLLNININDHNFYQSFTWYLFFHFTINVNFIQIDSLMISPIFYFYRFF